MMITRALNFLQKEPTLSRTLCMSLDPKKAKTLPMTASIKAAKPSLATKVAVIVLRLGLLLLNVIRQLWVREEGPLEREGAIPLK